MIEGTPLLSLVLDVDGADPGQVRRSVASVTGQALDGWELVLHGTGAGDAATEAGDPRVRSITSPGSAPERVREALRGVSGEFMALMSAGDRLAAPDVVELVGDLLDQVPDVDFSYGDELVVDDEGTVLEQVRRPAWSPERLLGQPWVGSLAVLRSSLVRQACEEELLDPWERDLVLRVSSLARRVERLPAVLLHRHRHSRSPDAMGDQVGVVRAHLRRSGVRADVTPGVVGGTCRVTRSVPDELAVTVVVPSCGRRGLAWGERRWFVLEAVRSLLRHAGHTRVEVVVVHTVPTEQALLGDLLALGESVRLVPFSRPFSAPEMVNLGALSSASDAVVVMDERTEVVSDGFLTELLGPLTDEGVGLSGPRLLDERGTLVDAGLAFRRRRVEPLFAGSLSDEPGPGGLLTITHECSGLSNAFLALRRPTFELVGGLSPLLLTAFGVDLSFKLRHLGLRRVWVPAGTAYLFGSPTRLTSISEDETLAMRLRWLAPRVDEYAPVSASSTSAG